MKKPTTFAIALAVLFSGALALAQHTKPASSSGKAATAEAMPSMAQMHEHMKKMEAMHDRVMSATTPEERQSAMEEGRKDQEGMNMMKPMMHGGGMMGGGMMVDRENASSSATQIR